MKRVAIFGNAGGGKSTLARHLSELTRLPLYPVDRIEYRPGGDKAPREEYLAAHARILREEAWILDGFGCVESAWERFASADTLVYVDLPLRVHYLWATKRFLKSALVKPEGWPDGSSMWQGLRNCYRVIPLCERHLGARYRQLVADSASAKRVHHLKSAREMRTFLGAIEREFSR